MSMYEVPPHLQQAILRGRCIAFVGAGFSAGVAPDWRTLLERISVRLGRAVQIDKNCSAFHLEAVGQRLQDDAGDRWEPVVRSVLEEAFETASPHARKLLERRRQRLLDIPFKAILTTNFDPSLRGTETTPATYWSVLRDEARWWSAAPSRNAGRGIAAPIVKLHGDANGTPHRAPLVLGRADYRKRVYEDPSYASFLRAVFAGYTLLFLGVSFTDAYLNELRSEVLRTIGPRAHGHPWGYAVMNRPTEEIQHFFDRYEGIHVLADPTEDHTGFDGWLGAIESLTSVEGRLRALLAGKRIVWVDSNVGNNEYGHRLLTESSGATLTTLTHHSQLDETTHGSAQLLLTNFGRATGDAFGVLERVNAWSERPPVIVFAAPATTEQLRDNRAACLRRGAFEYAVEWGELYSAIERVLGRTPGSPL